MPSFNQKDLPLLWDLQGGFSLGGIPVPLPFIMGSPAGIVHRPDSLRLTRPSRGVVINTAESAFLDDYGRAVPLLTIHGNTGWDLTPLSGVWAFKILEAMFTEYLERRKRLALA